MPENKLNIYQKLIEVRKSVPGLSKDKENKFFKFAYVSSSQTLAAVRTEMDKQQLLLIPAIIKHETRDHTTKQGGHQFFTELTLEYKWVNAEDPTEFVLCPWAGIGLDEGEKGIGKACTYSEKYFLLKFFNVPTDKDDPDSGNGGSKTTGKTTTTKPTKSKSDKSGFDKRTLIRGWLKDMAEWGFEEGNEGQVLRYKIEKPEAVTENVKNKLVELTKFESKDPNKDDFAGFDHTEKLNKIPEKWLNTVYGKVEKAWDTWKEKFDNSQE